MNNPMTYIQNGDYLIPDLKLSQQPEKPLGKYGRMRKTYLKEHRPILYNQMLLSEKLYPHLLEIDETAQSRLEQMMPQLAKEAGATEELKASDPMKWVGLMNTRNAQAQEIMMSPAPWGREGWKALRACSMECSDVQQEMVSTNPE